MAFIRGNFLAQRHADPHAIIRMQKRIAGSDSAYENYVVEGARSIHQMRREPCYQLHGGVRSCRRSFGIRGWRQRLLEKVSRSVDRLARATSVTELGRAYMHAQAVDADSLMRFLRVRGHLSVPRLIRLRQEAITTSQRHRV